MAQEQKRPNYLKTNIRMNTLPVAGNTSNILSKRIIELDLTQQLKDNSSPDMFTSRGSIEASSKIEADSNKMTSSPYSEKITMKRNSRQNFVNKRMDLPNSVDCQKTDAIRKKKLYNKTLPKKENSSESSSYCASQGRVIYEEFWNTNMMHEPSVSLSTCSTSQREPQIKKEKNIKVVGIKNIHYDESKFSGAEEESQRKSPCFLPLSVSETEENTRKIPNIILTNIALARKNFSSQLFLGSLTPPSNKDMAAYNKRKIDERKRSVASKWVIENKNSFKNQIDKLNRNDHKKIL